MLYTYVLRKRQAKPSTGTGTTGMRSEMSVGLHDFIYMHRRNADAVVVNFNSNPRIICQRSNEDVSSIAGNSLAFIMTFANACDTRSASHIKIVLGASSPETVCRRELAAAHRESKAACMTSEKGTLAHFRVAPPLVRLAAWSKSCTNRASRFAWRSTTSANFKTLWSGKTFFIKTAAFKMGDRGLRSSWESMVIEFIFVVFSTPHSFS